MKNSFLKLTRVLLISCLFCIGCKTNTEHNGYTITGIVKGAKEGAWVKLKNTPSLFTDPIITLDSTKITNGTFKFTGNVANVDMVGVYIEPNIGTYFFLDNNTINIAIDVAKSEKGNGYTPANITGSKTQALYELQKQKMDSIRSQDKYSAFIGFREMVMAAKQSKDSILMEQVKQKMTALEPLEKQQQEELKEFKINFVKNNPNSPIGPKIMGITFSEIMMSREEMKTVYNLFKGDAVKSSSFAFIKKTYQDYVEKFVPGATAPDFTLTTNTGEQLTLSKVKGKYILVDFWASWCIPCRASFPKLKKVYNTYKNDGFEVVGVATGDKDKNWRDAIVKDQTPWLHVFDENKKSKGRNGDVADAYGVPFLPTTYLLDSNLKIILRNPTKEELDAKLIELFRL
ncbi:redoxin domain-containing protein [Cellulophaga omnivescoria]|uniref:redoxin domain-containing protein n=1 Tax=Cellulophaga omnivescoria TaxID=1888890 RepID=UPI003EBC75C1